MPHDSSTSDPVRWPADRAGDIIDVFCDAFRDYPVMRHVLGSAADDDDRRLRELIGFFVMTRVNREEPVFAILDGSTVAGAATMTLPDERESPAAVAEHRERTWANLGTGARTRYEAYGRATGPFFSGRRHHHLNMIGVRRPHAGRGLARRLLESVHAVAEADPASEGVSLTTETPRNLPFYEHFGYRVVGHARVAGDLETWGLFRERP